MRCILLRFSFNWISFSRKNLPSPPSARAQVESEDYYHARNNDFVLLLYGSEAELMEIKRSLRQFVTTTQ